LDSLAKISQDVVQCARCELRLNATCPVPGFGADKPKYVLIGEAPGREEDETPAREVEVLGKKVSCGIPFIGMAGKKLDKFLKYGKIDPNTVYFTNVCRCRPPENRTPKKKEIKACLPFLYRELFVLNAPNVITLGATPLSLFTTIGVKQLHGTSFEYELKEDILSSTSVENSELPKT